MASIINIDGSEETLTPADGKTFKLDELQAIVGGFIEVINLGDDRLMVINEEGKILGLSLNEKATRHAARHRGVYDSIVGRVVLCRERGEDMV